MKILIGNMIGSLGLYCMMYAALIEIHWGLVLGGPIMVILGLFLRMYDELGEDK